MMTDKENGQVRVWDPLIRIFHWMLVASFVVAYISSEDLERIHVWSGYLIGGLLIFRLVWGFAGSRHARFSDFLFSPRETMEYGKSLLSGKPRRYLGHNPAGALMVFALLFSLMLTVISGVIMETGGAASAVAQIEQAVLPAKAWADDDDGEHDGGENEMLEEVHEFFANLTLLLIFLHITGVVASSRLHRENLVRAMVTGYKPGKAKE